VAFVIVAGAVLLSVIVMLVRKASSGTGGAGGAGGPGGGFKPGSSPTPTA
jgi:preprotein translocase subunit SecG